MQTYSIPVLERERYLSGTPYHKTVTDSRGQSKILWPITFDVPADLLVHLEDGRLHWIELNYLSDHGETVAHVMRGQGAYDIFLYHGLLSVIRPEPRPSCADAYRAVLAFAERLLETSRFQSDLAPGKWKTIFTAQLFAEQWKEGETFLRRLIEGAPHPYR